MPPFFSSSISFPSVVQGDGNGTLVSLSHVCPAAAQGEDLKILPLFQRDTLLV